MKWFKSIACTCALILYGFVMEAHAQVKERSISDLYNAVKSETEISRMETLVMEMEKRGGSNDQQLTDVSRQMLAIAYAREKNAGKAAYWAERITEASAKDYTVYTVIEELTKVGALDEAEKLLKPIWEKYKKNNESVAAGRSFYPQLTTSDFETQYGVILYQKGSYKKALFCLMPAEAVSNLRGSGIMRAEYYAMALARSGETEKALEAMNKLLLLPGHRSASFKEETKKIYTAYYGNATRYDQLMDSLLLEEKQKMQEKITKMVVNEPAPDFTVTDLDGNPVTLKSLRGKTVVLDFWATWCQPCIASFPGMQRAVDFYKNDPSVAFMFIHTSEHSADPVEDVKRFMTNKKYRLPVFMDLKDKETKKNIVLEAYKIRAIPAKFIIDKEGVIRYKNSGYVSEEEAVLEIGTMIDNIGKENNDQTVVALNRGNQPINQLSAIKDEAARNEKIKELMGSEKEQELMQVWQWYYLNKESAKAEEVMQLGIKKFPKGEMAYSNLNMKLTNEKDYEKKEALVETILKEYPAKSVSAIALFDLVTMSAQSGNKERLWHYLDLLKRTAGNTIYFTALSRIATIDPVKSEPLLMPLIDSLEKRLVMISSAKDTSRQGVLEMRRTNGLLNSCLTAYSEVLIENGKAAKAYDLMSAKYSTGTGNSFKSAYLNTLLATKRYKEAFPIIEDAIRDNIAPANVKAKYRDAYIAVYGSDKGFKEHEKELLLSIKEKIKQDALKHAINQPAPLFTLKDVDGNNISLADLKGKVVVMDFWATWCGPCKASFPTMQMAVNKYKDDPNVKFVFIHTWEKGGGDPVKDAKDYVVNNNYSFHVLMDLRDPKTLHSAVASAYKVSGIPTKIVVDPAGNMRFNVSGFNGIAEVAMEEISAMIEYAKRK